MTRAAVGKWCDWASDVTNSKFKPEDVKLISTSFNNSASRCDALVLLTDFAFTKSPEYEPKSQFRSDFHKKSLFRF